MKPFNCLIDSSIKNVVALSEKLVSNHSSKRKLGMSFVNKEPLVFPSPLACDIVLMQSPAVI